MKKLDISREEKIETIQHHFSKIMEALDLDLSDSSLKDTPARVAKMYVDELFSGLNPENFPKMRYFECTDEMRKMVLEKEIAVESVCEHHFVPISGKAAVAYIPKDKLIGLSKIPRLVNYFCKKPQLQERLTTEIASALSLLLETDDVAVWIQAKHFCVATRGIKDPNALTITQDLRGKFKTDLALAEQFLLNIH
jgi:GTP cyclohydrolase I